jgi:hypothetical protein
LSDIYVGECSNCHLQVEGLRWETFPGDLGYKYYRCTTEGCNHNIKMTQKVLKVSEKKKYTIVYNVMGGRGNMKYTVTKFERVETDNLIALIEYKYSDSIQFVFLGWPQVEGEI